MTTEIIIYLVGYFATFIFILIAEKSDGVITLQTILKILLVSLFSWFVLLIGFIVWIEEKPIVLWRKK